MKQFTFHTIFALGMLFTLSHCNTSPSGDSTVINATDEKKKLADRYSFVPKEELMNEQSPDANKVLTELRGRFNTDLQAMQAAVAKNGATLMVAFLSPEVGVSITKSNAQNGKFIEEKCKQLNIQYTDLTSVIASKQPTEVTQMPKDGHWSKAGAQLVAQEITKIIDNNSTAKCSIELHGGNGLYGDGKPGQDEILDGGKAMPYRVQMNKQGLRMTASVDEVKKRQRILFLGDSELYCPFLDNEYTITEVLASKFPDKEILNAGMWGYCPQDYLSLYKEKAQYANPDIVVLVLNGNDVLDYYFSQRNKLGRNPEAQQPTESELAFYNQIKK